MTQTSLVTFDRAVPIENAVAPLVFVIPITMIAALAGAIAIMCIHRGGDVEFKTKFWALVQVSCKFH